ncbi:ABC transporter permease [Actinobacteria bacterium YIM 96077]|uniref:ABC transporter permease n=1 Tax=Phytoactinopolyspora halophila TaxID=1981511 RepID=A0A329QWF7_9ACTN|nr:ABC transporter permease [Phytoactinopolyspora halophila]AYY12764.1 ABC transporter permease [Actinobacteria bacterium YIM 96077]RAW16443.1 ABC transporter permease [Phytoactinopolyspora halophila]
MSEQGTQQGEERLHSARAIVWARRRAALSTFWRLYRTQRAGLVGLAILIAITLLTVLAPLYTDEAELRASNAPGGRMESPSTEFWFGTDQTGRSILLMVIWGARVSLQVGVVAAVLAVTLGTLIGMAAAHFGGWISWVLMRLTDWFIVLPNLVLAIALVIALGPSRITIIAAIALTSWASTARVVRAQTMAIEGRPYIERAQALGAGHWHQMTRHVLPNLMPLVLASATLQVSSAILAEASLSFLGLGDPSQPSWGTILERAFDAGAISVGAWWYMLPPGIAILLVVLAFTLCGRAMESVLNPRLRDNT